MPKLIFNGGNPLPGCPKDWDEARAIEDAANNGKNDFHEPRWKFDCGFKLDFDGPLVDISSRFYPPKTDYGPKWDGTVTIYLLGEEIAEIKFESEKLEELRAAVESNVKELAEALRGNLLKRGL